MQKLLVLTAALLLIGTTGTAEAKHNSPPWRTYINFNRHIPCSHGSFKEISACFIWRTFPKGYRDDAFRVARCETVNFTDFYNDQSGATDLFQEMPGNDGRIFKWNGRAIRLNFRMLSGVKPTWYMTRVALFQSHGGTDWGEWACKP